MSSSSRPNAAEPTFERVAVVGLGVIGGSLARALVTYASGVSVVGWSPDAAERAAAVEAGAVGAAPPTRAEAVAGAGLVVVAAPLAASVAMIADLAREAAPDATLIDVASLKDPMARSASAAGLRDRWVGCHPMAGSERAGFAASRADLFEGCRVWTVAFPEAGARLERVHRLWENLGARPRRTEADEHDALMALVSHLPQLASNALVGVLLDGGVAAAELGPGGRAMTRLAASNPIMWRDILAEAPDGLVAGLRALARASDGFADLLEAGQIEAVVEEMRKAASWRGDA